MISVQRRGDKTRIAIKGVSAAWQAYDHRDKLTARGFRLEFFGQRDDNDNLITITSVQIRIAVQHPGGPS
jgi:hypothetical protein